jgi:hypothetical protein
MKKLINFFVLIVTAALTMNLVYGVEALEHEIKATYLYNFAKFIDWPPGKSESEPVYLCVMDKDFLKKNLEVLTKDKSVKNRPLQVRLLDSPDEIKDCHVLYVGKDDIKKFPNIKQRLNSKSLLSVGEAPDFINYGGQIQFFVENNNVSFEIDLPGISKSGLKLDARVLNIAKVRR